MIGKGAYGQVYKAIHLKSNTTVAIKYIRIFDSKSLPLVRSIARELEILYRLTKMDKNYFTVRLYDAYFPSYVEDYNTCDSLYIVMDYTEQNL